MWSGLWSRSPVSSVGSSLSLWPKSSRISQTWSRSTARIGCSVVWAPYRCSSLSICQKLRGRLSKKFRKVFIQRFIPIMIITIVTKTQTKSFPEVNYRFFYKHFFTRFVIYLNFIYMLFETRINWFGFTIDSYICCPLWGPKWFSIKSRDLILNWENRLFTTFWIENRLNSLRLQLICCHRKRSPEVMSSEMNGKVS